MWSRPDDKSAPKACYTNEGERGPCEPACHTNLSAPISEPVSHPDGAQGQMCSTLTSLPEVFIKKSKKIPPRRLAFCGGGVRCVAHVGVLKAMAEEGLLHCVKEVIGISAGALFALLWTLGYTIPQMERLALEFDFTTLRNIEPENLLLFSETFGLDTGEGIDKLICSILKQKGFGPDITFAELSKACPVQFRCYATELQTSRIRDMGSQGTPHMKVRTAVRASMSLPLFYMPVKDDGSNILLVDGGLLHNLPLVFLNEAELQETWGVLFTTFQKSYDSSHIKPIQNMMEAFRYIYDGAILMRNIPYIEKFKEAIIAIPTDEFSALNFEETKQERIELIQMAMDVTKRFIYSSKKPRRRFSAA